MGHAIHLRNFSLELPSSLQFLGSGVFLSAHWRSWQCLSAESTEALGYRGRRDLPSSEWLMDCWGGCFPQPKGQVVIFGKVILSTVQWSGRPQKWCHAGCLSSSDLSCQNLTAFASVPSKDLGRRCGVHVASQERGSSRLESQQWSPFGHWGQKMCCCLTTEVYYHLVITLLRTYVPVIQPESLF